jgi:methionyl-tRNA synthetase
MSSRQILMTTALPYANGPLHLGHILEHIQSNIWARVHQLQGHDCIHICASDAHGTPIMLKAKSLNISPEELVAGVRKEHIATLSQFSVEFDNFHTTHSPENKNLAETIYTRLKAKGDIEQRAIFQAYDESAQMFLSDRFIKGTCPHCKTADQYGDNCEACGATYSPSDLIDPRSVLSNSQPVQKESIHHFFQLPNYTEFLKNWISQGSLAPEVSNKLQEWFQEGLASWDISRDAPYFGFPIPGATDKYFYVWLDAPVGYMASFKHLSLSRPELKFEHYWDKNSPVELYHFIGKDIIYFHALFWPAMLSGADFRLPTGIFAHGFLTINGQKMSKSRGTFINAQHYLANLPPEYLRYYLAAKLNDSIEDLDLNWEDFLNRINADLIGKFVNIASRCAGFIEKQFNGILSKDLELIDEGLYHSFVQAQGPILEAFESRRYHQAIRQIMHLADQANKMIDQHKPWALIKDPEQKERAHQVCSLGINLFRVLITYLSPVLVETAKKSCAFLNLKELSLAALKEPLRNHTIAVYQPLLQRLTLDELKTMTEIKTELSSETTTEVIVEAKAGLEPPLKALISIDDFNKVDLRLAKIIQAEAVPEADKLVKLLLDLGAEQRQVFAGIKAAYAPEDLVGKMTVMVANLAPRKMRFGLSEGMVLAAGPGGSDLFLLEADPGASAGMAVK